MKKTVAIIGALLLVLNMVCLPASAEQTDLDRVITLIDALPESYQVGNGDIIAEIDALIETNGFTKDHIGSAKYIKYYTKHKNPHNTWLRSPVYQDRIRINWQEKNPLSCVDMFEYDAVKSVDEIAYKPGIVMKPTNDEHFPATVPYGSFIGFYNIDTVKAKYPNTFPDKFGEYYINGGNNFQYVYSGISEKTGDTTYNAGIVSASNSYEIRFDGSTKYNQVSFLMSGINYLAGEYARQAQAAKTTIYFADGTSKEQLHIIGPFCYGYRMSLYSTLEDKEVIYSEYLGTDTLAQSLDTLWSPDEANIDRYFKIGDGIRIYNQLKDGTYIKTIGKETNSGNATAVTVDTDNKAIDRIKVSYATVDEIKALGGVAYSKYTSRETTPQERSCSNSYFIPINRKQLENVAGYEEERDYYIGVIHNVNYPVYLHAVTASKTEASAYVDDIAELEEEIKELPENFDASIYEELNRITRRIDFLLNQGVSNGDFDKAMMEKLTALTEYNVGADGSYEVHIAPNGNDKASGSKNDPLKTLDGARVFVKNLKKDRPVNVIFHEGVYHLDKTVVFAIDDSGKEGFPVTYRAEGDAVFTTADTVDFKDFTLVKEGEDSRIPSDLIGKIYKADLDLLGIDAGAMPMFYSTNIGGDGFEDILFFVNDKEQMVAQYPNGESNYDTWVSIADTNINSVTIKVDALRSKGWQGEKYAYFEGYPSVDYSNERNNLTIDGDLIKFKNPARFDADEKHSRRYKIKHALSELDVPGEWYLDRDTNIFYYYPTKDFDENAEIQFAARKLDTVNVINADYINFDGLKFDKIRGNAFTAGLSVKELNLYNCEFKNISNRAVQYNGVNVYNSKLWGTANYHDGAENCEVRNNRFINIGGSAINFAGGERETLSRGNNVIANNYVYNASNKQRCTPNIQVNGVLNYALNNEVHMGTFHAINHSGNENVVAYNELYNMLRDTGDCGVIYNGRQLATRGTEIAYNYIHDYKQLDERTKDNCVGVYLDDRLSGISIHHNIIFSNGVGEDANGIQNGGGHHNKINYNTIVDADETMTRANRFVEDYRNHADCTAFDEIIKISGVGEKGTKIDIVLDDGKPKTYDLIERNEFFFERYPEMNDSIETLLNPNETVPQFVSKYPIVTRVNPQIQTDIDNGADLTNYRLLSLKSTIGNEYIGNISNTPWRAMTDKDANGVVYDVYREFGSVFEDNIEDASKDTFVNYEERDFRIKGSTNGGALDESFDLNTIGLSENGKVSYDLGFELNQVALKNAKNLPAEYKEFNLTYPENNGRVADKKNVTFMWERPVSSDYFTLEIATDPHMNNIVYKNENSYFNFETVTSLPEDVDTFYWRVTARNIARDGSKWQNSDGVNVFHTYDLALVEMPASVQFDIEGDFNVDVFNNQGETHNDKNLLGGLNKTLGMYNLTNLKRLVPADGYYKFGDTVYEFPQVGYDTNSKNAISTKTYKDNTGNTNYTYTLKETEKSNYDYIRFAMSAAVAVTDYEIEVYYTDSSHQTGLVELCQYYTTYYNNPGYDIILTVDGVQYDGGAVSSSNKNKIYQVQVDTDENKTVDKVKFIYNSGNRRNNATNNEYIFAITGIKNERALENGDVEKPIVLNNYSGESKNVLMIVTGNDNGSFKVKTFTTQLAGSKFYPHITITIPKEVYSWTDKKVFIWENNKMSPLGAKRVFFK